MPNNPDPARLAFATALAALDQRISSLEVLARMQVPNALPAIDYGVGFSMSFNQFANGIDPFTGTVWTLLNPSESEGVDLRTGQTLLSLVFNVYCTLNPWPAGGLQAQLYQTFNDLSFAALGAAMQAVPGGVAGGSGAIYTVCLTQVLGVAAQENVQITPLFYTPGTSVPNSVLGWQDQIQLTTIELSTSA